MQSGTSLTWIVGNLRQHYQLLNAIELTPLTHPKSIAALQRQLSLMYSKLECINEISRLIPHSEYLKKHIKQIAKKLKKLSAINKEQSTSAAEIILPFEDYDLLLKYFEELVLLLNAHVVEIYPQVLPIPNTTGQQSQFCKNQNDDPFQQLFVAVESKNICRARSLMAAICKQHIVYGSNTQIKTTNYLHIAVKNHDVPMLQLLLDCRGPFSCKDLENLTQQQNRDGLIPICLSIQMAVRFQENKTILEDCLRCIVELRDLQGELQNSKALGWAIQLKAPKKVIETLYKKINYKHFPFIDKYENHFLHLAVLSRDKMVLKAVLAKRWRSRIFTTENKAQITAIELAVKMDRLEMIDVFIQRVDPYIFMQQILRGVLLFNKPYMLKHVMLKYGPLLRETILFNNLVCAILLNRDEILAILLNNASPDVKQRFFNSSIYFINTLINDIAKKRLGRIKVLVQFFENYLHKTSKSLFQRFRPIYSFPRSHDAILFAAIKTGAPEIVILFINLFAKVAAKESLIAAARATQNDFILQIVEGSRDSKHIRASLDEARINYWRIRNSEQENPEDLFLPTELRTIIANNYAKMIGLFPPNTTTKQVSHFCFLKEVRKLYARFEKIHPELSWFFRLIDYQLNDSILPSDKAYNIQNIFLNFLVTHEGQYIDLTKNIKETLPNDIDSHDNTLSTSVSSLRQAAD